MRFLFYVATLGLAYVASGCATFTVARAPADDTGVDGLRVQVAEQHRVVVLVQDGTKEKVRLSEVAMPSLEEHYDVNFHGRVFSAAEMSVTLHPNGTLKTYGRKSTQKATDAANAAAVALSGTASAVRTLRDERRARAEELQEANKSAPVDELGDENVELQKQLLNLILRANQDAAAAGEPLPYPEFGSDDKE